MSHIDLTQVPKDSLEEIATRIQEKRFKAIEPQCSEKYIDTVLRIYDYNGTFFSLISSLVISVYQLEKYSIYRSVCSK